MRQKPTPPTIVLLVRHGLTPTTGKEMPYSGPGPALSDEGRQQAEAAGHQIAAIRPSLPKLKALYTSPLVRTRETAGIVGGILGLEPVEKPSLVDCDMGQWAGQPLKDLARKPEWAQVQRYPSAFEFPGGETISGMQARMVQTVHQVVREHPGEAVVVVSHADPIKSVLADALGMHLDLFQRLHVATASVSAVSYAWEGPGTLFVNWTPSWPGASARPAGGRRK